MSQAAKSTTTTRLHFASAGATRRRAPEVTLMLSADQAETLTELCTLAVYSDGFTYTPEMTAACKAIADRSGPAAIAACVALADIRERLIVRR